jgi:hypothetical protein
MGDFSVYSVHNKFAALISETSMTMRLQITLEAAIIQVNALVGSNKQ